MVGERIRDVVDRKPVIRRIEDRVESRASRVRNIPGDRMRKRIPSLENRNLGGGLAVGAVEAAIAKILKDTVGLPFGSDTEVVDTEIVDGGVKYVVNVDAPAGNMAEVRAFMEAGTGFTSLLTDLIKVEEAEVLKTRIARDTYQVVVLVED